MKPDKQHYMDLMDRIDMKVRGLDIHGNKIEKKYDDPRQQFEYEEGVRYGQIQYHRTKKIRRIVWWSAFIGINIYGIFIVTH